MARISVKMPNSNGVAAGQTATWKLPTGRRYHTLEVIYSNITLAQMLEIRVKANGETIHQYNGVQRDVMNRFDSRAAAGGILTIAFDRFNLYSQTGEEATAIQTDTADPVTGVAINQFELEIDIDPATVNPQMTVYAQQSENDPARPGPGLINRVLRTTRVLGSTGFNDISDLQKATEGPKYQWVNRVFFASANTTEAEIVRDNRIIFQRTKALNDRKQVDGVRVPITGWYVIDPTEEGYDFDAINLTYPADPNNPRSARLPYTDYRYRLNLSAAETVTVISEYLGTLNG